MHFNGAFTKADDVDLALTKLEGAGLAMSEVERDQVTSLFVELFEHQLFTGRSGGMYAYEGIGSIYWHMVSKLLLAVSEVVQDAVAANAATVAATIKQTRLGLSVGRYSVWYSWKRTVIEQVWIQ